MSPLAAWRRKRASWHKAWLMPRGRGIARLHRQPVWRTAGLVGKLFPRGAGVAASLAFILSSGLYGLALSGETNEAVNEVTTGLGFKLSAVSISGQREINEEDILDSLSIPSRQSLFLYDADAARARLAANPWTANVSVMKLYPGTLRVILEERVPTALWQTQVSERAHIIDSSGQIITDRMEARFAKLPRVIGDGAETRVHEIMTLLDDAESVRVRVRASMFVSRRRWDLFLDNGVQVMLPEKGAAEALALLDRLNRENGLLDRDIRIVDLRLADRIAIRLSPTAKAARDALIEIRGKALKDQARDA